MDIWSWSIEDFEQECDRTIQETITDYNEETMMFDFDPEV